MALGAGAVIEKRRGKAGHAGRGAAIRARSRDRKSKFTEQFQFLADHPIHFTALGASEKFSRDTIGHIHNTVRNLVSPQRYFIRTRPWLAPKKSLGQSLLLGQRNILGGCGLVVPKRTEVVRKELAVSPRTTKLILVGPIGHIRNNVLPKIFKLIF